MLLATMKPAILLFIFLAVGICLAILAAAAVRIIMKAQRDVSIFTGASSIKYKSLYSQLNEKMKENNSAVGNYGSK